MNDITLKARNRRGRGLDAALGHRVAGGLFNRDYPARASVGNRSRVSPAGSSHRCKEHEQLGTELVGAAPR
jgi:hypothetical protein